jgi:DNA-binding NarL/FixJ family response regulator
MLAPLRIIIADDHAFFRRGLKSMLELQPRVTVVAEVDRVAEVASTLAATPCDILLLDLQMDRSAQPDIGAFARCVPVVVITASERSEDAPAALKAGARAVVFKRFAIETLMEALRAVTQGQVWMLLQLVTLGPHNSDPATARRGHL